MSDAVGELLITRSVEDDRGTKKRSAATATATATPITVDGDRPQKKFYRQRAHCNPLAHNDSYEYPLRPENMQWRTEALYPVAKAAADGGGSSSASTRMVPTVLDIGCGYGGLTLALAALLPEEWILGMEIRAKVAEYVRLRIVAARKEGCDKSEELTPPQQRQQQLLQSGASGCTVTATTSKYHHDYANCAVLRTNSMKFLPNYFPKGSIHKLFFCFPDPHFKRKNHPRRIVAVRLLSEYAYVLNERKGRLYCITDVKELHDWHVSACDAHPLFRRLVVSTDATDLSARIEAADPCIHVMKTVTEEGHKVDRNHGEKYYAVYERIADVEAPAVDASNFFR